MKAHTPRKIILITATSPVIMNPDISAARYVPLRYRTPSPDEINTRRTALDLKIPTEAAIRIAAPAMAALIDGPCWLAPVPASNGSFTANLALARAIAEIVPAARVKCVIARAHPVESSHARRLQGLPRLTIAEHSIIRTVGPMQPLPVYFVDNLITTGTTIAACRRALGWGTGLAYADACKPYNAGRITLTTVQPLPESRPAADWQAEALHEQSLAYGAPKRLPKGMCVQFLGAKKLTLVYPRDYMLPL